MANSTSAKPLDTIDAWFAEYNRLLEDVGLKNPGQPYCAIDDIMWMFQDGMSPAEAVAEECSAAAESIG